MLSRISRRNVQGLSIIVGEGRHRHFYAANHQFNNLDPLADDLPKPKPDLYDGAPPQQIDRHVRRDLGKHIVPSNNTSLPAAPNFFMEGKSESGRANVARRQACHTTGRLGPTQCTVSRTIRPPSRGTTAMLRAPPTPTTMANSRCMLIM